MNNKIMNKMSETIDNNKIFQFVYMVIVPLVALMTYNTTESGALQLYSLVILIGSAMYIVSWLAKEQGKDLMFYVNNASIVLVAPFYMFISKDVALSLLVAIAIQSIILLVMVFVASNAKEKVLK